MREVNDNPVDPLGSLGPAVKPATPTAPDQFKAFEHINDSTKAMESVADTLRKKQAAAPVPTIVPVTVTFDDGSEQDGLMVDYESILLGCI